MLTKWMSLAALVLAARVAMGGCAPEFNTHPLGGTLGVGSFVTLKAQIVGGVASSWEWRRNGVPLTDGGRFHGVTTPVLLIDRLEVDDAGAYSVVATNDCGPAESQPAVLAVDCNVRWELRQPTGVSVPVYDSKAARTLVFGAGGLGETSNTWTWDGAVWKAVSLYGPSGPYLEGAYDSARGIVVGLQGTDSTASPGRVWEFASGEWVVRSSGGPLNRTGFSVAFDAARAQTVLFGGIINGVSSGETWGWDGSVWTFLASSGPSARYGHALSYDSARGVVVLFGGVDSNGWNAETWEWNGVEWALRTANGPSIRYGHSFAYDAKRGVSVLVGGTTEQGLSQDVWEWDGSAWIEIKSACPVAGTGHRMTFDAGRGVLELMGRTRLPLFEASSLVFEFNGQDWRTRCRRPETRRDHQIVFDESRGEPILFGGSFTPDQLDLSDDTWAWDGNEWNRIAMQGPPARLTPGFSWDAGRHVGVLFGGRNLNPSTPRGDTWEWNGTAWNQVASIGPSPRFDCAMAYDPIRGVTVLFGGTPDGGQTFSDTWEWNGSEWTLADDNGPLLYSIGLVFDPDRRRVVLQGRQVPAGLGGQTWTWSGTSWELLTKADPELSGRWLMQDQDRGTLVACSTFGTLGQTWEFLHDTWVSRVTPGPPVANADLCYDGSRRRGVLFGTPSGLNVQTWELRLAVEGDANADNLIDGRDLSVLLTQFGQSVPVGSGSDMNNDGFVDGADLGVLLSRFGEMCAP